MGGYVAMEMARLAPERMAGLALLNTAHRADDEAKRKQRAATIKMAESDRFRGVTRHLLKSFLSPQAMADEAVVARVFAMTEAVGRTNFVRQQHAILGRRDQSDTLAGMQVPVLVLCGGLDTLTPPALSVDMAGLVPDSRLVILDDVGHLSSLEAPQAVTGALQQLFDAL
jgi:pimeloyl-ACP methyl ester carboxylesterase